MEDGIFEASIEKLVTGGAGLARVGGEVVFLPGALPGERVRARIARKGRGFTEGELVEILDRSPDRVDPPEAGPGALVGADLCYMNLSAQRAAKREIVRDCFLRLGKIDLGERLEEAAARGPAWGYRNKIRLRIGPGGRYGMHGRGTHRVVPFDRSLLMPDAFNDEALPLLRELPRAGQALVRLDGEGRFLVDLLDPKERPERFAERLLARCGTARIPSSCAGILVHGRPVWGEDRLTFRVAGKAFRVHADSFFQVNLAETEGLVETARAWLDEELGGLGGSASGGALGEAPRPAPLLLDLYGGVGLFAVSLADRFEKVVTVESERTAVRDARENLRGDPYAAAKGEVVPGLVEKVLRSWKEIGAPFGDPRDAVAVVDPPRTGLAEGAVRALGDLAPRFVLYVSCDPATLARDCRTLAASAYEVVRVRPVDMFPQTPHVETLALLARR